MLYYIKNSDYLYIDDSYGWGGCHVIYGWGGMSRDHWNRFALDPVPGPGFNFKLRK